jgi:hypothetical protein
MNILSFLGNKLVLLVACLLPLWSAAQKDSVMGDFAVHLHGGIGMAYQDNSFAEKFIAANLKDNINLNPYMFAGLLGVDIEYKRFGIEMDGVTSIAGNSSSTNAVLLTNASGVINLTYVFARFERVDLKALMGIEAKMSSLVAQNQLSSPVPYNTLTSRIDFMLFSVGGDILWRLKLPAANKHASAYWGLRIRYGRSLGNNGWSYVPVENTNGGHLNTFLLGVLIGIGSRN